MFFWNWQHKIENNVCLTLATQNRRCLLALASKNMRRQCCHKKLVAYTSPSLCHQLIHLSVCRPSACLSTNAQYVSLPIPDATTLGLWHLLGFSFPNLCFHCDAAINLSRRRKSRKRKRSGWRRERKTRVPDKLCAAAACVGWKLQMPPLCCKQTQCKQHPYTWWVK